MTCTNCGSKKFIKEFREQYFKYKDYECVISQPGTYCCNCGEGYLSAEDLAYTESLIQDFLMMANSESEE